MILVYCVRVFGDVVLVDEDGLILMFFFYIVDLFKVVRFLCFFENEGKKMRYGEDCKRKGRNGKKEV